MGSENRQTIPATTSTTPGTPTTGHRERAPAATSTAGTTTTGLRERGSDTSKSTGRSGRQNAATRRNMRRDDRVTVQGPVKKQRPDGMSQGPQTKVTIAGQNKIYGWENLIGPFLTFKLLDAPPPSPPKPPSVEPSPLQGPGCRRGCGCAPGLVPAPWAVGRRADRPAPPLGSATWGSGRPPTCRRVSCDVGPNGT